MKASEMTNEELAKELMSRVPLDSDRHDDLREAAARLRNLGEIGEAVGREATREKSSQVCNEAAMREAVENALDRLLLWNYTDQYTARMALGVVKKLHAAISAPPRNCDRPECATTKAAQDVWRKEDGGKTAYYKWLLATYTKGGTDGRK